MLTILAVMASVAVVMSDGVVDQGKFDATKRTLHIIDEAIFGPESQRSSDGSLMITGFVADMGRVPTLVPLPNGRISIPELYANPGLAPFTAHRQETPITIVLDGGLSFPHQDFDVQLLTGWRSQIVAPTDGLLNDAWGNQFLTGADSFGNPAIISSGPPLAPGQTSPYTGYIPAVSLADARYRGPISGTISLLDYVSKPPIERDTSSNEFDAAKADQPSSRVYVVLYEPNPITGLLNAVGLPATRTSSVGVYKYSMPSTIGPRVIRAYELDSAGAAIERKSRIISVTVPSGGIPQELTIGKTT